MRKQLQVSEWILSSQMSVSLNWECKKDLCCHFFLFAVVVNFVNEMSRKYVLNELLYADNLVLMRKTIDGITK